MDAQSLFLGYKELSKVRNARFLDAIFDACSIEVANHGLDIILVNQQLHKLVRLNKIVVKPLESAVK